MAKALATIPTQTIDLEVAAGRVRWARRLLREAGVQPLGVQPGATGSSYLLTVAAADATRAQHALAPVHRYRRRATWDVQGGRITAGLGLVVALAGLLVSPAAGICLLVLVPVLWFVYGRVQANAVIMRESGSVRYWLAGVFGVALCLVALTGMYLTLGYVVASQIIAGNSALVLLERAVQ